MTRFRRSSKSPRNRVPREQGAHVQGENPVIAQRLRDLPVRDELREALGDRGLPHPRLANVDGVVLQPPAEHLDRALEDLLAADERVDLPVARLARELHGERGERLLVPRPRHGSPNLRRPALLRSSLRLLRTRRFLPGFRVLVRRVLRVGIPVHAGPVPIGRAGQHGRAVRNVGQEGEPVDALPGEEVGRERFLLVEDRDQHVVDLDGPFLRGGGVLQRALQDRLEAGRLHGLRALDHRDPVLEETLQFAAQPPEVAAAADHDLLAPVEGERGVQHVLGGEVLVAARLRLVPRGEEDGIQVPGDFHAVRPLPRSRAGGPRSPGPSRAPARPSSPRCRGCRCPPPRGPSGARRA